MSIIVYVNRWGSCFSTAGDKFKIGVKNWGQTPFPKTRARPSAGAEGRAIRGFRLFSPKSARFAPLLSLTRSYFVAAREAGVLGTEVLRNSSYRKRGLTPFPNSDLIIWSSCDTLNQA